MKSIGSGVEYGIEGRTLIIKVSLDNPATRSASGKSEVIASTHGNAFLSEVNMSLGLNLYRKVGAA